MTKLQERTIKRQCNNCIYKTKAYSDGDCEMFKQGIMNIINTSWCTEKNKCKLRKVKR
jgi:hypothetical protein